MALASKTGLLSSVWRDKWCVTTVTLAAEGDVVYNMRKCYTSPREAWYEMTQPVIESIETIALQSDIDEPFGYAQAWVCNRTALLVRMEATDGTVGWGECWGPAAGSRETINELLAPLIQGRDPMENERIFDDMYEACRRAYQTVVPFPALSGIDIALWDLKARLQDIPISSLLGGRARSSVRAYATGHYFKSDASGIDEQYERITEEARRNAKALGAVKAKIGLSFIGYGPEEDVELVHRIREAIGDDATLMVDANYAYDTGTARQVGHALEELDVYWFEEPVPPEHHEGYRHLRDHLDIRIAGGECHTPAEIGRLAEMGAIDVAQPDVCNVGGLTPARRVAERVQAEGVQVVPHVWGTPIAMAASLHLISTLEGRPWLEFDRSSNPLRDELGVTDFDVSDEGHVSVPEGPGLGIRLDPNKINRYHVE